MRVNNLARKTMGILMAMLLTSTLALNAFAAEESNVSLDEQEDSIVAVEQARKWFVQNHLSIKITCLIQKAPPPRRSKRRGRWQGSLWGSMKRRSVVLRKT